LFNQVIDDFKKEWNPSSVEDTIKSTPENYFWDHVMVQAYFYNLGKRLGYKVGCEKYQKWDVAWTIDRIRVQIEIEHGAQAKISQAFSKISRTFDNHYNSQLKPAPEFAGILIINNNLEGQTTVFNDYFFDYVLSEKIEKMGANYPFNGELSLLVIDLESKNERYRIAKVGPGRAHKTIQEGSLRKNW
jgi:hypothetical protein